MTEAELVRELTLFIRDRVRPHLGAWHARAVTGTAESGDATFAIDDVAEDAIVEFITKHDLSIAYYSEDKGLIKFGARPKGVLVIDPIDGTRPALAGFEQCVVAVSWSPYSLTATMGDVRHACVAELKQNDVFVASRGKGAVWYDGNGNEKPLNIAIIHDIAKAPLSFEVVARPLEYLGVVLDEIVNAASMNGGCFLYSSTAYSLTRLLTGQLAAVLDVGNRIARDHPWTRDRFIDVGKGTVIGLFTYDIAAAALIASEGGAIITDSYGHSFEHTPLLDTSEPNVQSICAASTPELHEQLINAIGRGSDRLRST
jgi:myo-inositol-1(or 4)-monophosphatase